MQRVLVDHRGRRLVLAEGVLTRDNVLMVQGEPLIQLDDAEARRLPPFMMEAIAAVVPGARIEAGASEPRRVEPQAVRALMR